MITAFEMRRIRSRVAETYMFLCQCAGETAVLKVPVLALIDPLLPIVAELAHNPRRYHAAQLLRDFFTQPLGREAAIVLGHARAAVLTNVIDTNDRQVEYGIDKLGPFRFTTFRKRRFLRKKAPILERISFEELCLRTDQSHDAVTATFRLIDATVELLLPMEKK